LSSAASRPRSARRHRPPAALLLTTLETAALLSIGRTTVYELIAAGELETVHIGRSVRVPTDAVARFISRLRVAAAAE
jgi:excisionase family DNA binding protein